MNQQISQIKNKLAQESFSMTMGGVGSYLANLLQQAFSGNVLELQNILITTQKSDYLKLTAQADSFLGITSQEVEVIFFIEKNQLECLIKSTLPKSWNFSQNYPDLPYYTNYVKSSQGNIPSFFYDLQLSKPMTIIFSSCDYSKNQESVDKLNLLDNQLEPDKIHQGLNYFSDLNLVETIANLVLVDDLLDEKVHPLISFAEITDTTASLSFHGYLEQQTETKQRIKLIFELSLTKKYKNIFNIGISSLVLYADTIDDFFSAQSGIGFIGGITIGQSSSEVPHNIALIWPIGTTELIIQNAEPIPFPGFDTFAELLEGHLPTDNDSNFPVDLSTLYIREIHLALSLAPPKVSDISLSVGPAEGWSHTLIKDVITIEDILLKWELSFESNKKHFYVLSAFRVGGGLVNVGAVFPELIFYGELGINQEIDLSKIFKHFLPNVSVPEVSILDCALSADIKQKNYELELDIASDWKIPLGNVSVLPLKNLRITIEKNPNHTFATIDSVMTIAEVDVLLLATNANEADAGGWQFSGSTQVGEPIDLTSLIEDIAKKLDLSIPTHYLPSIKLKDIKVDFTSGTKEFEITGTSEIGTVKAGENASYHLVVSLDFSSKIDEKTNKRQDKFFLKGLLVIDGFLFKVTCQKGKDESGNDTDNFIIDGDWTKNRDWKQQYSDTQTDSEHKQKLPQFADDLSNHPEIQQQVDSANNQHFDLANLAKNHGMEGDLLDGIPLDVEKVHISLDLKTKQFSLSATVEGLGDISLLVGKNQSGSWGVALLVDVSKVSTASLPVVGDALQPHNISLTDSRFLGANTNYKDITLGPQSLSSIQKGIQLKGTLAFEQTSFQKDFDFHFGGKAKPTAKPKTKQILAHKSSSASDGEASLASTSQTLPVPASSTSGQPDSGQQDQATWLKVQKSIGPITFERVGVQWQDKKLWLLLDAAFSAGGVISLNLESFYLNFPLKDPLDNISVGLKGMDINFKRPPITINGGFLKEACKPGWSDCYEGELIIGVEDEFRIAALGAYARKAGHPSLFVFAVLDYPLGGPACFFVTGFAGGFGINRCLKLPSLDEVPNFPLVKAATAGNGGPFQGKSNPADALSVMAKYIPPQLGENWFAAGVSFTTYELLHSFALVTVSFGTDVEIALLGVSHYQVPPNVDPSLSTAYVQLALEVVLSPTHGFLEVSGKLMPASFIYNPRCHITGGFAFCYWFAGPHADEFVVTLGGYHPHFKAPTHYPQVPRLGYKYELGPLVIKGGLYFALTPAIIMAGLSLQGTFETGPAKASLDASADFLISWKPFHYEIEAHIDVSGSIDLLFTIHFHVGVGLQIWGPSFGGKARIELSIFSFTIPFGDDSAEVLPIIWNEFKQSFLKGSNKALESSGDEPKGSNICAIKVGKGLVKDLTASKDNPEKIDWVINAEHFMLLLDTRIPIKTAKFVNNTGQTAQELTSVWENGSRCQTEITRYENRNKAFGVGPVKVENDAFDSIYTITLIKDGNIRIETFILKPILKKVPKALWLNGSKSLDPKAVIENTLMGFKMVPCVPLPDKTLPVSVPSLQSEVTDHKTAFQWVNRALSFQQQAFSSVTIDSPQLTALVNSGMQIDTEEL